MVQIVSTDVEILGEALVGLGYNIKEYQDHVVCPRFKDKDLAAYTQGGVTAATLKRDCERHRDKTATPAGVPQ